MFSGTIGKKGSCRSNETIAIGQLFKRGQMRACFTLIVCLLGLTPNRLSGSSRQLLVDRTCGKACYLPDGAGGSGTSSRSAGKSLVKTKVDS